MSDRIRRAAVLGAGVMGSGIAAHLANAGIPCLLLDIVLPQAASGDRNKLPLQAIANLKKQKPSPIFTARALPLIEVGNLEDDLPKLKDCDWVVEVVKEDLKVKQALFARIEPHLRPDAVISSNTSGMSIKGMTEGRSASFKRQFCVTHFFNPVRYMKLLEIVAGEQTDPSVVSRIARFGEEILGKGVVYGKDTTNFIANRIGTYAMLRTLAEMQQAQMTVEEIDKIFGPAMGRPKSAVFRTADVVGLDTFLHVAQNCYDTLAGDDQREAFKPPAFLTQMVEKGLLGEKSGSGFYKKSKGEGGEKEILSLDLKTLEYVPQKKVRYPSLGAARDQEDVRERIATVMGGDDKAAKLAEKVTLDALAYASRRVPEIADDYVNVDRALRWGFGWEVGPFETWDAYGLKKGLTRMKELGLVPARWVEEMVAAGRERFYGVDGSHDTYWDIASKSVKRLERNPRAVTIELLKRGNKKLAENGSATLWDFGDGAALLEFHSKMNSIDDEITSMMEQAITTAEESFRALVIGNDGPNFSAGANIMALLMAIKSDDFESVRQMVRRFQQANQRMRYSPVPVVTAPFGLTLGGGTEAALGGNAPAMKQHLRD